MLDVALKEFLGHGYGGASVSRIVKEAGVSKTTVYSRFASKAELFYAIMERQIEQMAPDKILGPQAGQMELEAGLKQFANHMLALSLEGELLGINRLMYSESGRFPELAEQAARRENLGIRRVADFIRDCAGRDGIPCRDPRSIAEVFIMLIRGWYINAMLSNQTVTARQRKAWVDKFVRVMLSAREQW